MRRGRDPSAAWRNSPWEKAHRGREGHFFIILGVEEGLSFKDFVIENDPLILYCTLNLLLSCIVFTRTKGGDRLSVFPFSRERRAKPMALEPTDIVSLALPRSYVHYQSCFGDPSNKGTETKTRG